MATESGVLFVCPGCGEPGDPADSICPHCHYHHLGRLIETPGTEDAAETNDPEQMAAEGETADEGPPDVKVVVQEEGPPRVLFTYVCQNPTCQRVNKIIDEAHNRCFNCGQELWLSKEAREARWYEEHGRRQEGPRHGWKEQRKGRMDREKGEEMNRAAGRPPLARSEKRFQPAGNLSGGIEDYWAPIGPDPEDKPADYVPPELEPGPSGCFGCLASIAVFLTVIVAVVWLVGSIIY